MTQVVNSDEKVRKKLSKQGPPPAVTPEGDTGPPGPKRKRRRGAPLPLNAITALGGEVIDP